MTGESAISSPASPVNPSNSITPSFTTTASASFQGPATTVPSRVLRPRSTTKPVDEPSNTMLHTAKAGIPLPLSYTPTTHRISKAKKGKRVHACEFPGCHKVFTRAEHRRRHELNHNPEARFCCNHSECKRAFHRQDLLTRHIERHELEKQVENATRWKQSVQLPPIASTPPNTTKNVPMGSDMFLPATTQQQQQQQQQPPPNSMCIESLIIPGIQLEDQPMAWTGLEFPSSSSSSSSSSSHSRRSSALQGQPPQSNEDSLFYSYPESCASSTSDGATFSLASQARSSISSTPPTVLDQYPDRVLDSELTSSPMPMRAELQCWDPAGADMSSSHMMPFSLEGEFSHPQPSFQPSPSWQLPYEEHNPLQSTLDTWSL